MSDDADNAHDGTAGLLPPLRLHRKDWRVMEYRNGPYIIRRTPDNTWQGTRDDVPVAPATHNAEWAFGDCERHAERPQTKERDFTGEITS